MKQDLIKDLNEQLIAKFERADKKLTEKIDYLNSIINSTYASDDLKNNVAIALKDIVDIKKELEEEINKAKRFDNANKMAFYGKDTFGEKKGYYGYTDIIDNEIQKNMQITKKIDNYEELQNKIKTLSGGKILKSVNKSLENRIKKLNTKQGNIAMEQRRIVNNMTQLKINEYLSRIDVKNIIMQNESEEKIYKKNKEIDALKSERQTLSEIKNNLLGEKNLLSKSLGVKMAFQEKLTQAKINKLKVKKGILIFKNKQKFKSNVDKNIISKMKDKIKALNASIKNGIDIFKATYESYMNGTYTSPAPGRSK